MCCNFSCAEAFNTPPPGDQGVPPQGGGGGGSSGTWKVLSVATYQPYFDVDTADVLERVTDALQPLRSNFLDKTSGNPDLYGPFWICSTLVFLTTALGNLASYFAHAGPDAWHADIVKVPASAAILYGYTACAPLGLYFVLKYLGAPSGLVPLWCLYGYALFYFVPASFVCVLPSSFLCWLVVAAAAGSSAAFIGANLRAHMVSASEQWLLVVVVATVAQLVLGLMLKLYFFSYNEDTGTHPPS
eukprot:SM000645S20498  [mRNA]  locus=s645:1163:2085:- [translate_table: standard]